MRTTVDLDRDVLAAAKEIARVENSAIGKVISRLLRQALTAEASPMQLREPSPNSTGFQPFATRGVVVTDELINHLRDTEGI